MTAKYIRVDVKTQFSDNTSSQKEYNITPSKQL
jgi:hypothetical protein